MAEAVMRHQVEQAKLTDQIMVDSAGTVTGIWVIRRMRAREISWISTKFHIRV